MKYNNKQLLGVGMENITIHHSYLENALKNKMGYIKSECGKKENDEEVIDYLLNNVIKNLYIDAIYKAEFDRKRAQQEKLLHYIEIKIDDMIRFVDDVDGIMYTTEEGIKEYTHDQLVDHVITLKNSLSDISSELYALIEKF